MAFDGRINIIEIDDETRTVVFDLYRKKKISGTKLGPILGMSDLITPFKMACEIAGLYPGDKTNKYMEAGNVLEPLCLTLVLVCAILLLAADTYNPFIYFRF